MYQLGIEVVEMSAGPATTDVISLWAFIIVVAILTAVILIRGQKGDPFK